MNPEIPILNDDLSTQPVWEREKHETRWRFLVLLGLGFLFLSNLGAYGLWDPWETHYGEVTRGMVESYDWVDLWWGYHEKIGDEPVNGYPFLSKPIYIFWAEATFVKLFGYGDWSIRLPIALLAMAACFAVYLTFTKLYRRKVGLWATLVVATCPQFVMIARQAQTDMPFVATLTLAMMFLMMALFGRREKLSDRGLWWSFGAIMGFLMLSTIPQFAIIATDVQVNKAGNLTGLARAWALIWGNGVYHALLYLAVEAAVIASILVPLVRHWRANGHTFTDEFKDRELRRYYLYGFYVMCGQATMAKGLLGFMLPGFLLLAYMGFAWEWRLLKRLQVGRGVAITSIVMLPWYIGEFVKQGMAFYSRFFVHDHFNRLAEGVHEIDTGSFEHFLKWLGIGMFPWAALVPFVFLGFVMHRIHQRTRENRIQLMLFIWFFFAYIVFTVAKTKFHHYIFPALPPLAILVALWLTDFQESWQGWMRRFVVVLGGVLFLGLTVNLGHDLQSIRNLCTYKYDRPVPQSLPINQYAKVADDTAKTWGESTFYAHTNGVIRTLLNVPALEYRYVIPALGVLGGLGFAFLFFWRTRRWGGAALGTTGVLLLLYTYHYYMPMLSPSWSQKYLFEDYYDTCTPAQSEPEIVEAYTPLVAKAGLPGVADFFGSTNRRLCKEQVISWLLTWRGETFYTYDTIVPIAKEATQFEAWMKEWNRGQPFYVFMQQRGPSYFESKLNTYLAKLKKKNDPNHLKIKRWKVEKLHYESIFFTLMKASPVMEGEVDDEAPKAPAKFEPEVKEDLAP
jgi:4-amino-4-deoxy-L-arabinose transferase-like glycosyltransferase